MKKVLGTLICAVLLLALAPISVLAAQHIITDETCDLATLGLVEGDIISIAAGQTVTLIGDAATTYRNIKIDCGAGVSLTLENVKINNSTNDDTCALSFTGTGNSLTLKGVNTLLSGKREAGISVGSGIELTIKGTGSLTATGGASGAGIGGGDYGAGGAVTISGGTVTATGGEYGAGIGGGYGGAGGAVTIHDGEVTAKGGGSASGIGGGGGSSGGASGGAGGTVKIYDGTVTATGGYYGAGIGGGGDYGVGGDVIIYGGTVTATGGDCGAGIGGGDRGAGGEFTIYDGAVIARGGQYAAGIGGAPFYSGGTVNIYNGTVTATGGEYGAGIGGGHSGEGSHCTIHDGTVEATGGPYGAGIGGGGGSVGNIGGSGGKVDIYGGIVIAKGGAGGAGIGGGVGYDTSGGGGGGDVAIYGGRVKATGGDAGAGIGGGVGIGCGGGTGGTVTINGGTVEAIGGTIDDGLSIDGAGIGGGSDYRGGGAGGAGATVYISGGSVKAVAGGVNAENIGRGSGYSVADSGTLMNKPAADGGVNVYLTTVILDNVSAVSEVASLTTTVEDGYGINDTETDNEGRLYLYLPENTLTTAAATEAGSHYKAKNGEIETKNDHTAAGTLYIPPAVTALSPSGTDVPISGTLTVTFDKVMDSAVNGEVELNGAALAAGSWIDTQHYTASYSALALGTLYTVAVSGFRDSTGVEMIPDTSHSFTTRAPSSDASLSGLTISEGTLTPSFAGGTYTYLASVANSINKLTVTPTANDVNATISVNGTAVTSGSSSGDIALTVGANTITVLVTAQDSTTTQSYIITVTRASSDDSFIPLYTIESSAGPGGRISPSGNVAVQEGWNQTFTITPEEGYKVKEVRADGKSLGALTSYTFKNVRQIHTITVSFQAKSTQSKLLSEINNPFSDITEGNWFYNDVLYVYNRGLMVGISSRLFAPNTPLTRGMFVTLLYRISGESATYENSFSDIAAGAWYENTAAWAAAEGICHGIGNGLFAPEREITREQLAVMLYNYAKYQGYDLSGGENTNILSYNDALNISEYAFTALQWACGMGLIRGDELGNLNPGGFATRAETAAILQRFIKNMEAGK